MARLVNKGRKSFQTSGSQLPSPKAMAKLTGGLPPDRTINQYSKLTPTGFGSPQADILDYAAQSEPKIRP
jgi:hypothetical protein